MQSWFGRGALLLAVIGGVALVALEQPAGDRTVGVGSATHWPAAAHHVRPVFTDDVFTAEEATGSIPHFGVTPVLPLSDEQRGLVFVGVMNLPDVPEVELDPPDPTLPLAASVELQDLPVMVTRKVPQLDAHKFVKLGDRILVVDPHSRAVVAQIPRYRLVLQ
jgi:hypothetical protein